MKRIIDTLGTTEILRSNLPAYPIIGMQRKSSPRDKNFAIMMDYKNKQAYKMMSVRNFEYGNGYDHPEAMGNLDNILSLDADFFLFDSPQELFKWLSE